MKCRRALLKALCLVSLAIALGACSSSGGGSPTVHGSVYIGFGYYDPWYWRHYWYRPPYWYPPGYRPPIYVPPRPEHPIARPPIVPPESRPNRPASTDMSRPHATRATPAITSIVVALTGRAPRSLSNG